MRKLSILRYTDDIAVLSENEEGLEEKLNTVEEELESYGMKMNKTKIIVC